MRVQNQKITKSEQLKLSFCSVIANEAKQIPRSPTRQQINQFAPAIAHINEVAMTWL